MKKFDWNEPMTKKEWGILYLVCIGVYLFWYYTVFKDEVKNRFKNIKKKVYEKRVLKPTGSWKHGLKAFALYSFSIIERERRFYYESDYIKESSTFRSNGRSWYIKYFNNSI